MKTALVAGATGLVGSYLLELLLQSNRYQKVIVLTRNSTNIAHEKLSEIIVDFRKLGDYKDSLKADDAFCCLGTTMAKAKSKDKFYKVDYDFPLQLAKISADHQSQQFLLVSALGADKSSSIFYNRVKGEVEDAVSKIGFQSIHIFRPSLLLGPRKEKRSGEDAAKFFYRIFGFMIPEKYKGVEASDVAKAMLHFASQQQKGTFIHESQHLRNIRYQ